MIISNNYVFLMRFQNNNEEILFTSSNKDLISLGEFLSKNRNYLIKDIKVYERAKTRFVRCSMNVQKPILSFQTVLDQELIRRNYY